MRVLVIPSAAALLLSAGTLPAQPDRVSLGLLVGSMSDYGQGRMGSPARPGTQRQLSFGVPVRLRIAGTDRSSLGVAATLQWSYAGAEVGTDGVLQAAVGPDVQWVVWHPFDIRLAALLGVIRQRNDWTDQADHAQYGFETGAGVRAGRWRVGYSYQHAWVQNVRRPLGTACPTGMACPLMITYEPPQTLAYNRHALGVTRHF